MSSEWPCRLLSEVAVISSGKRPPVVERFVSSSTKVPIIGGGGVSGFTTQALIEASALITGRVGTLGKLHVSSGPSWPSDNALVIHPRSEEVDFDYLRYSLSAVIHLAIGMNRGAANPLVTQTDLGKLPIPLPAVTVQREIGSTLRALDDRITLLRETNATLEAIAQALFKSWFVDFDPVRAKMEGRTPEGMDEATAALFPDGFETSELGVVPRGWQLAPLSQTFEVNPSRKLRKGEAAPYVDMASVQTRGHAVSSVVFRKMGSGSKFVNGDTLLARITPCLENGKTAFVDCLPEGLTGWGSTEFVVLRPKPPLPVYFGYLLCRHPAFREFATQSMSGTSGRQRIQNDVLGRFLVAIPGTDIAEAFGHVVGGIQQKIAANHAQAQTLSTLRDTLLPRLISGRLRLPETASLEGATP